MKQTKAQQEVMGSKIGDLISKAMDAKGMSIRDLAAKADVTYEHVRKIVKGENNPSRYILSVLCKVLDLDFREAEQLNASDKITRKFGDIPLELSGKNPEMAQIERYWPDLTDEQKADATGMITTWAKRNRATKVS